MDKEKIKEILYGEQLRKEQDEEFARRLDSKNMFIKNAGPREPDWRMAQKVIEILKRNQAHAQKIEDKKRDHQRRIDELDSIIGKTIPSIECSVFNPSQHPYQPVPVNPESSSLPETRQDIFAKSPDKHQTSMPAPGVPAVLPGRGTSLEKRTAEPMPYLRGEDINSDYSSFLQANVIAGKPSQPVLLEDSTFYFALRAYASGDSVMLKGPSRSGKSLLADRISMLTDHVIIGGASNNALLDHIEDINSIGKVYITEHQSVVDPNPRIKEIIKHILEGKDYIFHSNGLVKELKGTTQILTTAADENKHIQKIDVELYSRYTPFRTGLTPEKIRDISINTS